MGFIEGPGPDGGDDGEDDEAGDFGRSDEEYIA